MKKYVSFIYAFIFLFSALDAVPAQVIIIRHAEKPPQGVSLSTRGRERAAALAPFIVESPDFLVFGTPVAIYAAGVPRPDSSRRSIETVTPLAAALKLPIKDKYSTDDVNKMVEEIQKEPSYAGKMVLICWEHSGIPDLARALGALKVPFKWPTDTYDRVWLISFREGRAFVRNMPQRLMYGDSSE